MIKARIAEATDHTDRRRASRHTVESMPSARTWGYQVEARVINLSATGFMAGRQAIRSRFAGLADCRGANAPMQSSNGSRRADRRRIRRAV